MTRAIRLIRAQPLSAWIASAVIIALSTMRLWLPLLPFLGVPS